MNCFYHPSEPAVAQCVDCGKGLCHCCATTYLTPICINCNKRRGKNGVLEFSKPLLICTVFFVIGYNLEIMGPDRALGGYMFMSIYAGWKFINQFIPNIFVWFSFKAIFWYYLIRIVMSMFVGALTTPFYLGYCIYKLIINLKNG